MAGEDWARKPFLTRQKRPGAHFSPRLLVGMLLYLLLLYGAVRGCIAWTDSAGPYPNQPRRTRPPASLAPGMLP